MTFEVSRSFVGLVFVVAGAASFGTAAGCSSSSATAPSVEAGNSACPATVEATVGAACSPEGDVCDPTFTCGFSTVTVRCVCTQGTFQCVSGDGGAFAAGDTPACGKNPTPGTCPATEDTAAKATCTQAESGQQCAYAPKCAGGTLAFDRCTCGPKSSGSGFGYECENSCNSGTGPVPEAGSSSGGQDAAPEASDAGSASDAPGQ
jgi:hypothetical protein